MCHNPIVTDFDISSGASDRLTDVIGLGVLTRLIDRDTVDEVLAKADRRETRVRLLPAGSWCTWCWRCACSPRTATTRSSGS